MYAPTGAMVAAPTTSLPEWVGGGRNWDYRYSWTRDAAMAIRSANLIGCHREGREFFYFVRDTFDRGSDLRVMYTVTGDEVPEEIVLPHLSGYGGSSPVRIGNAARSQTQLDTAGALIDAAFLHERFGAGITLRTWRHLREVAEAVRLRWPMPDHGIWEIRSEVRHNLHSKLMSWVALDRAQRLAPLFGGGDDAKRFWRSAEQIRAEVLENGLDASKQHFVGWYGGNEPDAALLLLPIYGLLPPADPRVQATVDWVQAELADGRFLYRYRAEDGVGGEEGAFVLCGFWLAEALALAGRIDEAQQVFVTHAEASNHLGLLAEEIEPSTGALLGNFPQAFSHLGLINAAARIDRALRLRDEGSTKLPRFLLEV
jgi:GH15 family glucan-1,4-alpha-glucosidase